MPFMFNRLPADTHNMVGYTTLPRHQRQRTLGIPCGDLARQAAERDSHRAPELERWKGSPYLCIYGESDADAACEQETGHDGTALKLSGGHHFGGGYDKIAEEILSVPTSAN